MNLRNLAQLKNLALRVSQFYDLGVFGQPGLTALITPGVAPGNLEVDGSIVNIGALIQALNALALGPSGAMFGSNFINSAGATITLTNLFAGYVKLTNGGAVTVTIDSAFNLVNALQYPYMGETFTFTIQTTAGGTVAAPTLSDTAVTLAGVTTVTTGGERQYLVTVTQMSTTSAVQLTAGTTFTSIAQVGVTNNFTVTLGVNAIVPVVGQVIYMNVTAGTPATQLPSGWYQVNKVTSATSFVVALPPGTVWTATAVTFPQVASVPQNASVVGGVNVAGWTPNLPGVYSPLVTITGQMGMAAGVMVT